MNKRSCIQTVFIYIMCREVDAVETKVVEILKDFSDYMKKLFGEAQNMCSVQVKILTTVWLS